MLTPAQLTAGRSDPHRRVSPGVAEGAEEEGRSCPLYVCRQSVDRGEERRS